MSSKTNSNVAPLMAFLLWNALTHAHELTAETWLAFRRQMTNSIETIGVAIFELIIVIFIVGALIGNVANATTGITIAHTGFTPNANLTASPGAVPLTQLYPLVFVAIGLLTAFEYFKHVKG